MRWTVKEFREKLGKILAQLYGVGIFTALMLGALSFVGYLAALILGGEVAGQICTFIYKKVYPGIYYLSAGSVLLGLLKMYVVGEKALTPPRKKKI